MWAKVLAAQALTIAKLLPREQWMVVEDTHEAIIDPEQWAWVQSLLRRDTRSLDFEQNISLFAGFLRCGDCGRAMSKTNHSGGVYYCCGSYKRYGPTVCTRHGISHRDLERLQVQAESPQESPWIQGLLKLGSSRSWTGRRWLRRSKKFSPTRTMWRSHIPSLMI